MSTNVRKAILIQIIYISLVTYLTWYGVFESSLLPSKIDSSVHIIRLSNYLESFSKGLVFPIWHDSPFWGYPENFDFFLVYIVLAIINLFCSVVVSLKLSYFLFYWLAANSSFWCFMKLFPSKKIAFIASILYISSASFLNFGLGSGSINRVLAYAFFPYLIGIFLNWWNRPSRKTTLILCLVFYASYLIHPNCTFAGFLTFILIFFGLVRDQSSWPDRFNFSLPWILLGGLLFSWQLAHLLISSSYISVNDVDKIYAKFILYFHLKSFFGFWLDNNQRAEYFYMGAFPLIIGITGVIFDKYRRSFNKDLYFSLIMSLMGFLILMFGQIIFQKNSFRLDLIYNFGISLLAGYFLSKIPWNWALSLIMVLIIVDQSTPFRKFAGSSYVDLKSVEGFIKDHKENFSSKRVRFDHLAPNFILSKKHFENLSHYYWIYIFHVFDVSPYNLGAIPHHYPTINFPKLYNFLGIPIYEEQKTTGVATLYKKVVFINAPERSNSYENVFRKLMQNKNFDPYLMPLFFRKTTDGSFYASSVDDQFKIPIEDNNHWDDKVINFLKTNTAQEIFSLDSLELKDNFLVLKEAYHPRRKFFSGDKLLPIHISEPGLVGIYSPGLTIKNITIENSFLKYEVFFGSLSLLALLMILFFLFF
jgi:hypothetical protein